MDRFYEILLISTSVVGFYVSFVLLFLAKQNRLLNRLLSFYTLSCSIFFLLIYNAIRGWGSEPVVAIRTFSPILLITPALGYLYFRALLEDETRLTWRDLIHTLPVMLNVMYFSPLLFIVLKNPGSWSEMVSNIKPHALFINPGPLPDEPIIIFRIAITLFYVLSVIRIFFLKKSYLEGVHKQHTYPKSNNWVLIVLAGHVFFGTSIIANQARAFLSEYPAGLSFGGWSATLALLSLDLIIIYAVVNPEILFGIPQFTRSVSAIPVIPTASEERNTDSGRITGLNTITEANHPGDAAEILVASENEATKISNEVSTEQPSKDIPDKQKEVELNEAVQLLVERIHSYVARHQPYRNQEFNIASLSKGLGVPQHHIAFIFRQVLHKSFVEYRNALRVEYVKEAIQAGKHKQLTIEAIGTEAGFTSKTTFFAVFKELMGMTPGQYAMECTPPEST